MYNLPVCVCASPVVPEALLLITPIGRGIPLLIPTWKLHQKPYETEFGSPRY